MQEKCFQQNYRTNDCNENCRFKPECDKYFRKDMYIDKKKKQKKNKKNKYKNYYDYDE